MIPLPTIMGVYSKHIFPWLLDWSLGNSTVREQRHETLASLQGHVLEIGFGTGLNLPCYPPKVTRMTAVDSEVMLPAKVAGRIAGARMPVERVQLDAGRRLPFEDDSFDGVVTTFTLCSISDVASALSEIRRVLKPVGTYVFLEHGRSDDRRVAKCQDRFNPIQKFVARGCNLNRPIERLIRDAGLEITKLDRYRMANTPRFVGEMYRGAAVTG